MELKGKTVLVFGAGISGIGAAVLLNAQGAHTIIYDGNDALAEAAVREKLPEGMETEIVLGRLPWELIGRLDLAVVSPGVPMDLPAVILLKEAGVPIWGEVELAYRVTPAKKNILAITGTNGKTTTTSLLGAIMKQHQEDTYVVGNIGTPYTGAALEMTEDSITVAEISSFQLETITDFHPHISAILNITPDHLNRHHTMEEYIRVKERITEKQNSSDTCVLNYEDPVLREFGSYLQTKVIFFSSLRTLDNGICLNGETIEYREAGEITPVCRVDELKLLGLHNVENVMAATAMAMAYGVPLETIRDVLRRFTAVEHRIEFVAEKRGVAYYNDSKGTNPDAAIKGIQAMNRKTVLIGGGYDKESSYEEWINAFDGKVKYLVLIGQTKYKIAEAAKSCGFHDILFADTLEEAVALCAEKAEPGDAVLLSPACASWGMFPNYEVRGRRFKELVHELPQ